MASIRWESGNEKFLSEHISAPNTIRLLLVEENGKWIWGKQQQSAALCSKWEIRPRDMKVLFTSTQLKNGWTEIWRQAPPGLKLSLFSLSLMASNTAQVDLHNTVRSRSFHAPSHFTGREMKVWREWVTCRKEIQELGVKTRKWVEFIWLTVHISWARFWNGVKLSSEKRLLFRHLSPTLVALKCLPVIYMLIWDTSYLLNNPRICVWMLFDLKSSVLRTNGVVKHAPEFALISSTLAGPPPCTPTFCSWLSRVKAQS